MCYNQNKFWNKRKKFLKYISVQMVIKSFIRLCYSTHKVWNSGESSQKGRKYLQEHIDESCRRSLRSQMNIWGTAGVVSDRVSANTSITLSSNILLVKDNCAMQQDNDLKHKINWYKLTGLFVRHWTQFQITVSVSVCTALPHWLSNNSTAGIKPYFMTHSQKLH